MDSHTKTLIGHMSKRTKTVLTDKHHLVLDFAYEYYSKHKTGPLYQSIEKSTGVSPQDLEEMFPNGLTSVYTWVGIPVHAGQKICKPAVSIQVDDLQQVYLDHAATTPLRDEIAECLREFYGDPSLGGNPSSSNRPGKRAYEVVAEARSRVSGCLGVSPETIVFTSGGSEANNLAIKGIAFQHLLKTGTKGHVVSTKIEHSSVLSCLHFLEAFGFQVSYVDVNRDGSVPVEAIRRVLRKDTLLVATMAVNNETGAMNPILDIGAICHRAGVPLMVDAIQCFGKRSLIPAELQISLMSISGHKIGAPKGVGALYVREGVTLAPLIHGGEQEHGLRAGTENVANIHAFGMASTLASEELEREMARLADLHSYFLRGLSQVDRRCIVNGNRVDKAFHIVNVGFEGIDSGSLLLSLSNIGISVSAGSACTAGKGESSHVLKAMGVNTDKYGTVRFSFGLRTGKKDIDYLFKYLPIVLAQLRKIN